MTPCLFDWRTNDSREIEWSMLAEDRAFLNDEAMMRKIGSHDFIPDQSHLPIKLDQLTKHKKMTDFMVCSGQPYLIIRKEIFDLIEDDGTGRSHISTFKTETLHW